MARVIKLAQKGYDVKTAGDENLIYSSEWPLLPIYKQGSFMIGDVTQQTNIFTHNLGFVPMFWFFTNATIDAWVNSGSLVKDNRSEFFGGTGGGNIGINETNLQFVPQAGATGSLTIYYYIFLVDITKPFQSPIKKIGAVAGGSGGRVFKLAKPSKSVRSTNLDDFVIHSDCRSPLLHSVTPGQGSLIVPHNLGYSPMFFAYVQNYSNREPGYYELIASGSGGTDVLKSDTNTVSYSVTSGTKPISIVVLKDPFLTDYTRSVTI